MPDYSPETLLKLEYEFASASALQAVEQRQKVVAHYLLLAAALGSAGLLLVQLDANRLPTVSDIDSAIGPAAHMPGLVFALFFWSAGLAGFFTLLNLIRLRQAAHSSLRAMNRIKEFYVVRYPQLSEALSWRAETLPALNRVGSVTFNLALLVALSDSLAVGAGMTFIEIKSTVPGTAIAAGAALLAFLWQTLVYFGLLREK